MSTRTSTTTGFLFLKFSPVQACISLRFGQHAVLKTYCVKGRDIIMFAIADFQS